MNLNSDKHTLLILSQDFETYQHLIAKANLPGLSIFASKDPEGAFHICDECDLLIGEPARVSQVVRHMANLKWLQCTWAGIEPLLALGMRRDYLLTNARNVYGPMMSEYVFGYMLAIERHILSRWQAQLDKKWDDTTPGALHGKLLGLMGVGSIGAHLAETAKHFSMRVYGYTRASESCAAVDRYFHNEDWQSFAADLDYLVCTLPGTKSTRHLVDANFLSALPQKAWLLNVGRGSTIDEKALTAALILGTISGAVLDVFSEEPLPHNHPFWTTPNTYITFHTAARNYLPDIADLFIDNYKRFIAGLPLLYQVDFDRGY